MRCAARSRIVTFPHDDRPTDPLSQGVEFGRSSTTGLASGGAVLERSRSDEDVVGVGVTEVGRRRRGESRF
jgi:hypothetical protein